MNVKECFVCSKKDECFWGSQREELFRYKKANIPERDCFNITGNLICREQNSAPLKRNLIVLDFETTGITASDEVVQVSMIDDKNELVLNELCKPLKITSWTDAERVHGISPESVKECSSFNERVPYVETLISNTSYLMAFNAAFELKVLKKYGITPNCPVIDPMLMFAEFYGEIGYYGSYKWQKLEKCANYFKYEFKAHDALEDVKATLFCFKKMRELKVPVKYVQL